MLFLSNNLWLETFKNNAVNMPNMLKKFKHGLIKN